MRGNQPAHDVSYTANMHSVTRLWWFLPDHRAVGEIQMKIVKQGKRNAVSRHLHARNDKDKIAGWTSDLNRILHIFNVRSIVSVRLFLNLDS